MNACNLALLITQQVADMSVRVESTDKRQEVNRNRSKSPKTTEMEMIYQHIQISKGETLAQ